MTDDELAYHRHVLAALKAAEAAWRSWASWIATKYELGPRDSIDEFGRIIRSEPPPETPPGE